jgi:hypothetical protein
MVFKTLVKIYNTGDISNATSNSLVYGLSGSGKTPLAATADNVMIIATEPGLRSIRHNKLPYIAAIGYEQTKEALEWAQSSSEARRYHTIFFDSISAYSERVLADNQRKFGVDARKYSPPTTAQVMEIVIGFQSIQDKNVVMTSKAIELTDQLTGVKTAECFAAVRKLGPALPYNFDNVMFLSRHISPDGSQYSALRCSHNDYCVARNRSGLLALWEPANLKLLFNKENGVT